MVRKATPPIALYTTRLHSSSVQSSVVDTFRCVGIMGSMLSDGMLSSASAPMAVPAAAAILGSVAHRLFSFMGLKASMYMPPNVKTKLILFANLAPHNPLSG